MRGRKVDGGIPFWYQQGMKFALILTVSALTAFLAPSVSAQQNPGIDELHRLDLLPRLKNPVTVASVSSYDRTGGNDDGFSVLAHSRQQHPETTVILMTGYGTVETGIEALRAGCRPVSERREILCGRRGDLRRVEPHERLVLVHMLAGRDRFDALDEALRP